MLEAPNTDISEAVEGLRQIIRELNLENFLLRTKLKEYERTHRTADTGSGDTDNNEENL